MRHSFELTVPADVVEDAMEELSEGVRITIESSIKMWREKRMSANELEELLHSVSWQSPTLKYYFEDRTPSRRASDEEEPFEVISAEDMLALMGGAESEHRRKKARIECEAPASTTPLQTEVVHAAAAAAAGAQGPVNGMLSKHSINARSFRNLSLSRMSEEHEAFGCADFDLTFAFRNLRNSKSLHEMACSSSDSDVDEAALEPKPKLVHSASACEISRRGTGRG